MTISYAFSEADAFKISTACVAVVASLTTISAPKRLLKKMVFYPSIINLWSSTMSTFMVMAFTILGYKKKKTSLNLQIVS